MGVIRDRLREKYKNNGNRIDARWTLDDVVSADEISGSFLSASAYELSFPADQPDTARIECAKAFPLRNGPLVLITNLRTGQDAWQEPPIDEGQETGKHLTVLAVVTLTLCVPVIVGWVLWRKGKASIQNRMGGWLAISGFWCALWPIFITTYLINFQRTWERPPDPYFGAGLYVADGAAAAFLMGLLVVRPSSLATLGLHLVAAVVGGLVTAALTHNSAPHKHWWLAFSVAVAILIFAVSVVRYTRGSR